MKTQLYGNQYRFVRSPKRFTALIGGIGSGKSIGGAVRAALASQGYVGDVQIPAPNLGIVTAPTYRMLQDATIRTFFEQCEAMGITPRDYIKSELRAVMPNGSEILFRSTDNPDSLRGPNAAWAWSDEAALTPIEAWRVIFGRLRQFGHMGYAWITSTPKGRNWIWQEWVHKRRDAYAIFRVRTGENPFIDAEFFEALKDSFAGDYARQELDGIFVAWEGLIYPEFNRDVHMPAAPITRTFNETYAGVDWGYVNPGVILIGGVDGDGRRYVRHEEYARKRRIEDWVEVAKQLRDTYRVRRFFCDPSEPDYIKIFNDANCEAVAADNSVNTGIQGVKNLLVVRGDGHPRLMLSQDCVYTASEFESYQWAKHKDGLKDAPLKAGDHAMDALRYLNQGIESMTSAGVVSVESSRWAG